MTDTYGVADEDGFPITDGLQEHEAERIAQRIANRLGESVWLCITTDDDQPWPEGEEIEPQTV